MNQTEARLPTGLQAIIEDFHLCEGHEKLELLLEFAERMPPLPDRFREHRNGMDQVHECMTPVYVYAETNDGKMHFFFDIPPESPTVRGYAALLSQGLAGVAPEAMLAIPSDFYHHMGLNQVLSPQRLNGISAILAHMKRLAVRDMTPTS
ncbi:MAG: SufE family protein [Chloroflexaceae bacterium]|nr:SufE family protein [Chloroflexaceae bacterium]